MKKTLLSFLLILLGMLSVFSAERRDAVFSGRKVSLERGGGDLAEALRKRDTKTNDVISAHAADDVFLDVNGEILKWAEVDRQIDIMLKKHPMNIPPVASAEEIKRIMNDARRKYASIIVSAYLEHALLAQKARSLGMKIAEPELAQALTNAIRRLPKNLKSDGAAEAARPGSFFRRNEENYLLARRYAVQIVKPTITASVDEVVAAQAERRRDNEAAVRRNAELPAEMARIREEIVSGKISFEKAAKEHSECGSASEGGDMGEFDRDCELLPPLKEYAFKAKAKVISPVIQSDKGYHLLRVLDRDEDGETVHLSQILLEKREVLPELSAEEARRLVLRRKFNRRIFELAQQSRLQAKCRCAVPIRHFRDTSKPNRSKTK